MKMYEVNIICEPKGRNEIQTEKEKSKEGFPSPTIIYVHYQKCKTKVGVTVGE